MPGGGIQVETGHSRPYPEVTGYLIPTLLQYGDRRLAADLLGWLVCIQRPDGSYPDPDTGQPRIFDTAQVLRGLLAGRSLVPSALDAAERAAAYLYGRLIDGGRGGYPPQYAGAVPEGVHLYVLPPLHEAGGVLSRPEYAAAVQRCLAFYQREADFLSPDVLTHFLGYELDALIDLERADLAGPTLDRLRERQRKDGSISAMPGVSWTCTVGVAQLAVCWYKLGDADPADRAMAWLERQQERNGGFKGSVGPRAAYKQGVDISWGPKFFLDAHGLRTAAFFDRRVSDFPDSIARSDGRVRAIATSVTPGARVLEVGCGKGRFLTALMDLVPGIECTGVEPSPMLRSFLPRTISGLAGTLECNPCMADGFDIVFAVEALEHCVNPETAIAELIRVARPGGSIIIIDKQHDAWGRLKTPSWEWWPRRDELTRLLRAGCDDVRAEFLAYDGRPATDELMVMWVGRKRSPLSGLAWHQVLAKPEQDASIVAAVGAHQVSDWARAILIRTKPGERVLEIGSGTGQISLLLAQTGRRVTCLDLSPDNLRLTARCATVLATRVNMLCADALIDLPLAEKSFDCVWSAGLLEHFDASTRRRLLRQWSRYCTGLIISVVPNASSLAYQLGKWCQERAGGWGYGLEMPLVSMREDYDAAGIAVLEEFSVAAAHALHFLVPTDPVARRVRSALAAIAPDDLASWNQGYLLVTVGRACGA